MSYFLACYFVLFSTFFFVFYHTELFHLKTHVHLVYFFLCTFERHDSWMTIWHDFNISCHPIMTLVYYIMQVLCLSNVVHWIVSLLILLSHSHICEVHVSHAWSEVNYNIVSFFIATVSRYSMVNSKWFNASCFHYHQIFKTNW